MNSTSNEDPNTTYLNLKDTANWLCVEPGQIRDWEAQGRIKGKGFPRKYLLADIIHFQRIEFLREDLFEDYENVCEYLIKLVEQSEFSQEEKDMGFAVIASLKELEDRISKLEVDDTTLSAACTETVQRIAKKQASLDISQGI